MKTVKSLKDVKRRILIGTHSNIFHIGEVVAISILCLAHEKDEIVIIRSKKYEELEKCDYVVNVGEGNGENGRYGHYHKTIEKRKNGNLYGNAGFDSQRRVRFVSAWNHRSCHGKCTQHI